ncbi:hypothetical protein Droror1_Dr00016158 [Drosera rotundifolia]
MYIIRSDAGQTLREELAKSPHKLLAYAFSEIVPKSKSTMPTGSGTEPSTVVKDESRDSPLPDGPNLSSSSSEVTGDSYFQGIAIIKTLVKLRPSWLQNNRIVFDTLVLVWKSPARIARLQKEQELNLVEVKESKWLVKCFLNYIRHDMTEVNVLLDLLSIFLHHSRIDYTFLKEFFIIEVRSILAIEFLIESSAMALTVFPLYIAFFEDMRRDVQEIFKMTPHDKQVMMFSATLSKEIRPVCKKFMQDVMSHGLLFIPVLFRDGSWSR